MHLPEEMFAAIASRMASVRDLVALEQTCVAARRGCKTTKHRFLVIRPYPTPERTRGGIEWLRRHMDTIERLCVVGNLDAWATVWRNMPYVFAPRLKRIELLDVVPRELTTLLSPEDFIPICPVERLSIGTFSTLKLGDGFSRLSTLRAFIVIASPYASAERYDKVHLLGTPLHIKTSPQTFAPNLRYLGVLGRTPENNQNYLCDKLEFLSLTDVTNIHGVEWFSRFRNLRGFHLSNWIETETPPRWSDTDTQIQNPNVICAKLSGVWSSLRWMPASLKTIELVKCRGVTSLPRCIEYLLMCDVTCHESVVEDLEHMTLGTFVGRKVLRIGENGKFHYIAAHISAKKYEVDNTLTQCVFD